MGAFAGEDAEEERLRVLRGHLASREAVTMDYGFWHRAQIQFSATLHKNALGTTYIMCTAHTCIIMYVCRVG